MIDRTLLAEAKAGDVVAQRSIGLIYERRSENRQNAKRQNYQKAAFWYQRAANQGDSLAQFLLGLHYDGASPEPNYEKAAVWYRKAAEQGDADAQFRLGDMYNEGFGVPEDFAQAAFWYRQAAEQGKPDAQYYLANVYANGHGVRRSYGKAVAWYRKAIENPQYYEQRSDAQFELGILYKNGLKDYAQAAAWFRKAAKDGDLEALVNLADLYADGLGVRRNCKQAATWYRKAASHGNTRALVRLGEAYAEGKGVRKSFADAYYCLTFAAQERVIAEKKAAIAGANLTPAELSQAKRRVKRHLLVVEQRAERRILKLRELKAKMGKNYKRKPTVRKAVFLFR
jgi:TPR repeat protein